MNLQVSQICMGLRCIGATDEDVRIEDVRGKSICVCNYDSDNLESDNIYVWSTDFKNNNNNNNRRNVNKSACIQFY